LQLILYKLNFNTHEFLNTIIFGSIGVAIGAAGAAGAATK